MKKSKIKKPPAESFLPRLPLSVVTTFLIIWAFLVLKYYFVSINFRPFNFTVLNWIFSTRYFTSNSGQQSIKIFFEHLLCIFLLCVIFISAFGLGKKIWTCLKFDEKISNLEIAIFQVGLGIAGIMFFTLAVGLAGLLYRWLLWCFVIIFAIIGITEIKNFRVSKEKIPLLSLCVLVLALVMNLIGALTPETFYDSLVYNIGLPQTWINHNRIFSTRFIECSFFPLNFSVIYTVGIILKNEILAKLIVFAFGFAMLIGTYVFCKKYLSAEVGIIAGIIFYTVPMVMMISWKTAVELGLGFFEFLALFSAINFCNENKNKWLYLTGIFSGISLGGKYTSFLGAVALSFLIFIKMTIFNTGSIKDKLISAVKKLLLFGIIAFLIASVWYIKNFIITGNPLYPVLGKFTSHMKSPELRTIELTLSNILTFPWKYTMGELQQETFLGPVFLIFFPLLLFFKRIDKNIKYFYIYSGIFVILWFFIGFAYCRFLVVALPAISIIIAYYLISPKWNIFVKKCFVIFLLFVSFENIYYAALVQKSTMDPLGFILGLQSKKDYLSTQRSTYPCPYYQVIPWIDKNTPKDAKILVIGECRGFYLNRKYITYLTSDPNPITEYCKEVNSGDELYTKLKKDGITHVLFNIPEARRLSPYDILRFSERELKILTSFWNKYIEEVYSACADVTLNDGRYASSIPEFWNRYISDPKNYVYVYRLLREDEIGKPRKIPLNFFLTPVIYSSNRYSKLKPIIDLLSFSGEKESKQRKSQT